MPWGGELISVKPTVLETPVHDDLDHNTPCNAAEPAPNVLGSLQETHLFPASVKPLLVAGLHPTYTCVLMEVLCHKPLEKVKS
jgi:hypothetical protein